MKLTKSAEDYLEAVYVIGREKGVVKVSDIASHLGVSLPSVTGFVKGLADRELLRCERYGPVELTPKGRRIGRGVYEKHKLLGEFFMLLGVDRKTALHDACLAEHILSRKTLDRMQGFVRRGGR
jgi:DtxR family Mn-dependent transcriptional regulator